MIFYSIEGVLHWQLVDPKLTWFSIFRTMEIFMESHPIIRNYAVIESCLRELYLEYTRPRKVVEQDRVNFKPGKKRKNVIRYSIKRSRPSLGKIASEESLGN